MRANSNGWQFLELASRLSETKEDQYRQLLALSTLIELLVDKGILTAEEIRSKASLMEAELDRQLLL
ncbi:hypothetical protein ACFPVX_17550 [Cohnella faecalis]|uniref:Nitrile hydratase subunit beta n=1 Tax=Cohnella faecalis TaxID=2315694 RepID=A0A398CPU8_9BACL|nr:hypothetical protein [Cohnella faecalis]RIE01481.1 hypothetical protein D3H35_24310 [Cohnella faecalis]